MKKNRPLSNTPFYFLAVAVIIVAIATLSFNPVRAKQAPRQFNSPQELIGYLDSYASNLPRAQADQSIMDLIILQVNSQKSLEKQIFSEKTNRKINQLTAQDLENPSAIKDSGIKALARNVLDNGFRFSSSEGMNYIEIDFPRIMKQYGRYTSSAVFGYLEIMARETGSHFAEDAALRISLDELADRLIFIEKYTVKNQRFTRIADIQDLYRKYCNAYLLGLNNTPAFNYRDLRLNDSFLKLYQNVQGRFPKTALANKTADYLKVLEKSHYKRTKAVLVFASKASLYPDPASK